MGAVVTNHLQKLRVGFRNFFPLCKPRVSAMIVFTAVIGMFLATPGFVPLSILIPSTIGIFMASGAAAAFNCLIEQEIDARMARTVNRPLPSGRVSP
jgi:protoheme IX farnesyltransferase